MPADSHLICIHVKIFHNLPVRRDLLSSSKMSLVSHAHTSIWASIQGQLLFYSCSIVTIDVPT